MFLPLFDHNDENMWCPEKQKKKLMSEIWTDFFKGASYVPGVPFEEYFEGFLSDVYGRHEVISPSIFIFSISMDRIYQVCQSADVFIQIKCYHHSQIIQLKKKYIYIYIYIFFFNTNRQFYFKK